MGGTSPTGSRGATSSASLRRRLLRAPGAPLAALILVASIAFAVLSLHEGAHLRQIPSDGLVIDHDRVVSADERWPGLEPGDRIVAVGGVELFHRSAQFRMAEVAVHGDTTLRVVRGDRVLEVPVPNRALPPLHAATMWMRTLIGVLTLLIGAVGFALRPGTRVAWLFLLFCVALGVMLLFPVALVSWPWLFPATQAISFALSTALGIHTFCELPRRLAVVERHRWLPALLYIPTAALVALAVIEHDSRTPVLAAAIYSLLGCATAITILARGAARARRADDAALTSQYRMLLAGVTLGLLVPVLGYVVLTMIGILYKWVTHLNAMATIVYPTSIAYALLRQNVLGADRFTAVVVAYGATLAVVGLGCATLLVGVPMALYGRVGASPLLLVVVTATASLSLAPLARALKRIVDRRFQRGAASPAQLTASLREVVRLVAAGDRGAALAGTFEALRPLGADRAALYVLDPGRGELVREHASSDDGTFDDAPPALPATGPLGVALRLDAPGGVDAFSMAPLPADAQDQLWALGLALCAAVPVRGVVGGFLAVGPRASGSRYAAAEQSQLALLAAQVGLLLERGGDGGQRGRYRIERRLGIGGMAEVHLAWQVGPGGFERRVALKQPLPHITEDPQLVAMFLDEARLAASLQHPCIAQIFEVGRDGDSYFIAMEYVDGVSLRALLRAGRQRPVSVPRALAVVDALLRALDCAHDAVDARGRTLRLVHRDVTPANLLLSIEGDVKLVDFGVALAATRLQITRAGTVKGTPAYMSPEQKMGRDLDHRSDLFAAGVLFHELITGRVPWADGPPARPAPPPAVTGPGIDEHLAAVIARALAWDPADRYRSADAMREALLAACAGTLAATRGELASWVATVRADTSAARATVEEATLPAAPVTPDPRG